MSSKESFSFLNNNKRAILLLHGLTGHPYEMKFFGKKLSKEGFDVYCPTLPGHCSGMQEIKKYSWQDWLNFALSEFDNLKEQYDEVYIGGLCLGAVLACAVAEKRKNVDGICGLSTTLFLDGWEMPWFRIFMPFALSTVVRFFYSFPETGSYGIKNQRISASIAKQAEKNSTLLDCFPMICIHELIKLKNFTIKNASKVECPIILFHSKEDNLTSIKSSALIYNKVSSKVKELVKLDNCYHVITLDNEKENVAQKAIDFFDTLSKYSNTRDRG